MHGVFSGFFPPLICACFSCQYPAVLILKSGQVMSSALILFNFFGYLGSFIFYCNFYFCAKSHYNFDRDVIESVHCFGCYSILTVSILSIHEHEILLHLFASALIYHHYNFSLYQSFTSMIIFFISKYSISIIFDAIVNGIIFFSEFIVSA